MVAATRCPLLAHSLHAQAGRSASVCGTIPTTLLLGQQPGTGRRTAAPARSTLGAEESRNAEIEPGAAASTATLVVPTYQEVAGVASLVQRVAAVREAAGLDLELLLVDDDSGDGIEPLVDELRLTRPWVHLLLRHGKRSLAGAVVEGFRHARGTTLLVADADLSHPPELIPAMLAAISGGADMVVGSRYVAGGSIAPGWGALRRVLSLAGAALARPLTPVRDPLSGYFALRRELLTSDASLTPVGFKIGLELLVKLPLGEVVELPLHFSPRVVGSSKLRPRQQLLYLLQLARLYLFTLRRRARRPARPGGPA